jgi:hypothetical protein
MMNDGEHAGAWLASEETPDTVTGRMWGETKARCGQDAGLALLRDHAHAAPSLIAHASAVAHLVASEQVTRDMACRRSPPSTFSVASLLPFVHPVGSPACTRLQHGVPHPCVPDHSAAERCDDARRIAALAFALALAPAVLADCSQYDAKHVLPHPLRTPQFDLCASCTETDFGTRAGIGFVICMSPVLSPPPPFPPRPLLSEPPLTHPTVAIVFCLIFAAGLARRRRAARMQQAFRAQGVGAPSTGPVLTGTAWSQHVAGGPALPPTAYSGGYAPAYMAPVRLLLGRLRLSNGRAINRIAIQDSTLAQSVKDMADSECLRRSRVRGGGASN